MILLSEYDRLLLKKDPKSFLSKGFVAKERIGLLTDQITHLQELVTATTSPLKDVVVFSSNPSNRQEEYILRIIELQDALKREIEELVKQQRLIEQIIDAFAKPGNEQLVLTARYVNFYSIERIACDLHYSYRWILTIQRRALQHIKEAC